MTAQERLDAARQATKDGRYEDALRDLVWFHDHPLEDTPSMYGVRLSCALRDWCILGALYPPALQAMTDLRDRKTQALLHGEGDRPLFHDVKAINDHLGDARATHALYLALAERRPELASRCTGLALPAIVAVKDYALADRIRPAPEALIRMRAAALAADVARMKHLPFTRAPRRWAEIRGYASLVRLHLAISAGIGDAAHARYLAALAVDLIWSPSLRAAVRQEIARRDDLPRLYRRGWARFRRRQRCEQRVR